MNTEITYEEKAKFLRSKGWYNWYSLDNWIDPKLDKKMRIDGAGIPTDEAYKREKER